MTKPINELSDIELREAVHTELMTDTWAKWEPSTQAYHVEVRHRDGEVRWEHFGTFEQAKQYAQGYEGDVKVVIREGRAGVPHYESSIEAAFEVVGKLEAMEEHWLFKVTRMIGVLRDDLDALAWGVEFRACIGPQGHAFYALGADSASLPRAICIAALTAIRARKA